MQHSPLPILSRPNDPQALGKESEKLFARELVGWCFAGQEQEKQRERDTFRRVGKRIEHFLPLMILLPLGERFACSAFADLAGIARHFRKFADDARLSLWRAFAIRSDHRVVSA